jgi:3-oxoacyl-[acyl-carrier-protein] synthase-3
MIGIEEIGLYIPENKVKNSEKYAYINKITLSESVGFEYTYKSNLSPEEMCVKAVADLSRKGVDYKKIQLLVVITQEIHPNLPHLSTKVHKLLGLNEDTICFDFRLGCSGFVQSLSMVQSYMQINSLSSGLIINVETFSKYLNPQDDNSNMLLSDFATATFMSTVPKWVELANKNYTNSDLAEAICLKDGFFFMDGKKVYHGVQSHVMECIKKFLSLNQKEVLDFDKIIVHQASKRIVSKLSELISASQNLLPFDSRYGNTGSCSIPILLTEQIDNPINNKVLLVGFGSGFCTSISIIERVFHD